MVEKPLSKREVRQVRLDAEKHLSRALASSTWRGVESTHRRMLEFRGEWEAATGEKLSKAEATILWVRGSKEVPGISTSTALQYVQNVKSAEKRVGVPLDSQALRDFERSLKRQHCARRSRLFRRRRRTWRRPSRGSGTPIRCWLWRWLGRDSAGGGDVTDSTRAPSLEETRRVTRHSSIEALVRYLPAGKIALAAETAAASRRL
ncbi:hypothetical protein DIPPA_15234 [Diplonema papillatum]|nr:hypothetical protein DIPPA_15234 [Diplonema papillatum]